MQKMAIIFQNVQMVHNVQTESFSYNTQILNYTNLTLKYKGTEFLAIILTYTDS